MGDEILKQIARDLTISIKNNISVDWAIRESVQAKMKMTIKRLLKKYGYPPDKTATAVNIVMEQTKLMCQNESKWYIDPPCYQRRVPSEYENLSRFMSF